jgi:hypothetical protein
MIFQGRAEIATRKAASEVSRVLATSALKCNSSGSRTPIVNPPLDNVRGFYTDDAKGLAIRGDADVAAVNEFHFVAAPHFDFAIEHRDRSLVRIDTNEKLRAVRNSGDVRGYDGGGAGPAQVSKVGLAFGNAEHGAVGHNFGRHDQQLCAIKHVERG